MADTNTQTKQRQRQLRLNELLNTTQNKTYFVTLATLFFVIIMGFPAFNQALLN